MGRIRKDGLGLQLMDGSRWEIALEDITIRATWYASSGVSIDEEPDDERYPYRITNLDTPTPDVVRAKPR
jgi:hypothetical protein